MDQEAISYDHQERRHLGWRNGSTVKRTALTEATSSHIGEVTIASNSGSRGSYILSEPLLTCALKCTNPHTDTHETIIILRKRRGEEEKIKKEVKEEEEEEWQPGNILHFLPISYWPESNPHLSPREP